MIDLESRIVTGHDEGIRLNERLILQQNLSESEVAEILRLHEYKLTIRSKMKALPPDNPKIKAYAKDLEQIEFLLQDAWKFPRDANFHRFWETPHCSCPKMDNADAWPSGYYVKALDCPVHGCTNYGEKHESI